VTLWEAGESLAWAPLHGLVVNIDQPVARIWNNIQRHESERDVGEGLESRHEAGSVADLFGARMSTLFEIFQCRADALDSGLALGSLKRFVDFVCSLDDVFHSPVTTLATVFMHC
jgi:hypothetical protein